MSRKTTVICNSRCEANWGSWCSADSCSNRCDYQPSAGWHIVSVEVNELSSNNGQYDEPKLLNSICTEEDILTFENSVSAWEDLIKFATEYDGKRKLSTIAHLYVADSNRHIHSCRPKWNNFCKVWNKSCIES